ncbi:hypothetical protein V7x_15270 [Crateriforma conspicua]|uniref:Uncharacterized protein n=2 Tax=Planctomycetaceae TaxID=126 RepID=A0A5C6FUF3_9PLAN|nr:hypothetical protein V7x_15270 [Crateriforma conspicua]
MVWMRCRDSEPGLLGIGEADTVSGKPGSASLTTCKTVEQAMSVRKLTARIIAVVIMMTAAGTTYAQNHDVPPVDPLAFDPDFRWFEPIYEADLLDMKPKKRANTGWFATYDKLLLYGTRPETFINGDAETKLDNGSGHRYEIGYMLPDKDTGWLFNWTENDVFRADVVRQERINRYSLDDLEGTADDSPAGPPFGFIVPQEDRNNLGYNTRFYDVQNSQNMIKFDSYELNKTWRLEPYHYGGILEPMVGVRWMRAEDINLRQTYQSTQDNITGNVLLPLPNPILAGVEFSAAEQITSIAQITDNEMLTAQLGFRYFKHKGRFMYSSDFRVFAGNNWQCSEAYTESELTIYAFGQTNEQPTVGEPPITIQRDRTTPTFIRNEEFLVGFDVRGELGYQLTKAISVRAGFQVIDIGRGLWRYGTEGDWDQDYQMFGGTLGLTLNR